MTATTAPSIGFSTRRLMQGLTSSVLSQVIGLAQALLLVPLYLRAWGATGYGSWLAAVAAVSYLALLDLGGQSYIGNRLAQAFARGDAEDFQRTLSSALSFFVALSLGAVPVLIAVSVTVGRSTPERLAAILLGGAHLIAVPGGVLGTCYRATGRLARGNMVGNAFRALGIAASAAALVANASPPVYAFILFAVAVAGTLTIVIDLARTSPALKDLEFSWAMAKAGRRLLRGSLIFWVMSLSQALNFQGVTIILSLGLGASAVALFSTHRTAVGIIAYATSLLQPAVWSELSLLVSRPERDQTRSLTLVSIRAAMLLAGGLSLGLWIVAPSMYSIWTRHRFDLDPLLLGVLTAQAILMAGWSAASWPMLAANRHASIAAWSLANALATLLGTVLAVALGWGLVGAAIASVCADVICGLLVFPVICAHFLEMPPYRVYAAMGRALLALLPVSAACLLSFRFVEQGWPRLVGLTLVAGIFLVPTIWLALGRHGLEGLGAGLRIITRVTSTNAS